MQYEDKERFIQMAEDYDRMAPFFVPQYDFLQREMILQSRIANIPRPAIVDLGAGSGLFLEKALAVNPRAFCYWVDSSPAFLAVAQRRLARFGKQVTYINSAIESEWKNQVGRPVNAIFSMSAIHHLDRHEKQAAYRDCFEMLVPGGWFINTDEMRGLDETAYRAALDFWVNHVNEAGQHVPAELQGHARQWLQHFDHWKQRNIDQFDRPKTKGDDLHESVLDQVRWLNEIGFSQVDIFVKYHLWCSIGGRKPWTT